MVRTVKCEICDFYKESSGRFFLAGLRLPVIEESY